MKTLQSGKSFTEIFNLKLADLILKLGDKLKKTYAKLKAKTLEKNTSVVTSSDAKQK